MTNSMNTTTPQDVKHRRRSTVALRTLNTFAVDVMSIRSVDDLFWYVAQNVVGQMNFVDCVIYEAETDERELIQVAAWGKKNPFGRAIDNPLRISVGEGITGQVAKLHEPIIVDDLLENLNYIPDTMPARSEICVPIIMQGRVIGVIDSEHPDVGAFGEAELEVLTTVAAMTSAKLELLFEAERSKHRYIDLVQSHAQLTNEIKSRKVLEGELFQARKLEAIGRLTGGFAHGFNNLLTVIAGNLELLNDTRFEAEARLYLGEAQGAADRAAKLIRDMLAFSQKMRLKSEVVDLNELIRSACDQDRQALVGRVNLNLTDAVWSVKTDRSAADVALLNLILNAREAMPDGGALTIGAENTFVSLADRQASGLELEPGRYVRLFVSDEGTGMDQATMQQIFDPFFTTKNLSESSGLGLSMVQGFMKQSRGAIMTQSTVSQGTTFHLYFPVDE